MNKRNININNNNNIDSINSTQDDLITIKEEDRIYSMDFDLKLRGKLIPLYKIWPGKNRFLVKGKIMLGPKIDSPYVFSTIFCFTIVTIPYGILIFPSLIEKTIIIPILIANLFFISIIFYALTSFCDPGIVPRKKIFEIIYGDIPIPFYYDEQQFSAFGKTNFNNDKFTLQISDNKIIKFYFCKICKIFKPPKTYHCELI